MAMNDEQKKFCVDVATSLYKDGFSDWVSGMDTPKEHQGVSYYTGFKEAKKMYPDR